MSTPSEEILRLVHAFSDEGRKIAVGQLSDQVKAIEDYVKDCRDNFDCDQDAHKYNTRCRRCFAEQLIPRK